MDKVAKLKEDGDKQFINSRSRRGSENAGKEAAVAADDTTKAGDVSNGIMDIADTPDVAIWSKGIRKGLHVPSDNVKEPSRIASTTLHIEERPGAEKNIQATKEGESEELMIDPADKDDVAKVVAMDASLTDESDLSKETHSSSSSSRKAKFREPANN